MEALKTIIVVENVVCVYRNFSRLGKYQNLVFYRILFEMAIQIVSLFFYYKCSDSMTEEKFYYTISFVNSLLVMCTSVYKSKQFEQIIRKLEHFKLYYPTDDIYKKNVKSRTRVVLYFILVHNLYCVSTYGLYYTEVPEEELFEEKCSETLFYMIECTVYLSDCRFLVEVPVISVYYMVMSDQLDTIARSLKTEINYIKRFKTEHRFDDIYYTRFNRGITFDNWSAAYTVVEKKSKLCSAVFGFQLTALVVLMIVYYVLLVYGMVILSVMGNFTPLMQFMYLFTLSEFIAAFFVLSRAAQQANNSATDLRRLLCTLQVQSLGCKKQYKATRDFLRLVCTHPIQTRAFGFLDIDMTLLPTFVLYCTSYTVVALQFNNIL